MPTVKLVPSTYYLSNSSYLSVSNASNMYDGTDSANYATVTNSRTSTSSYYIYVRGFDLSQIPSQAVVSSFTVRIKANHSGGYAQAMDLYDGTSTSFGSSSTTLSTTVTTHTINVTSHDWADLVAAGSDLGIRINCRRASRNTTSYIYIYGAEIEVTYTIPDPRTITSTLSGNGTISPSGANTYYDGDEYELTITPTNKAETVTATRDGTDITSQLVAHGVAQSTDRVLGTYALVSGSFNGSGASYFQGLVGKGVDGSQTTSNYYSGGSSTIAVFTYDMSFDLPTGAVVERVYCKVNGHAESTSQSSEYMCVQLISGSTELSEEINFKSISTSNTTVTLECEDLPTVSQLANMKLQCRLGYYGGAINGATCYVEYSTGSGIDHYTYTYTVSGNSTIAVTISGGGVTQTISFKNNGTWIPVTVVYKKISGSWVRQTDLSNVFDASTNYVRGD